MRKLSFAAGALAGYVLGTRAGRRRYEQIKAVSGRVWGSEPVQRRVTATQERVKAEVKAAVPGAAARVFDAAADRARRAAHSARHTLPGEAFEPATPVEPDAE